MRRVLIVEDEPAISDLIEMNLRMAGYDAVQAMDGKEAMEMLNGASFDVVLLDLMLPEIDGFQILELLKRRQTPTIIVSAKANLSDRVKGLSLGADDYLTKPFEPLELVARVEALLRRSSPDEASLSIHGLSIQPEAKVVMRGGETIPLTNREFTLLMVLCRRQGVVFTREQLLSQVWGVDYMGETRTVDVHIQRLRAKLSWDHVITTVYRSGYRLEVEA